LNSVLIEARAAVCPTVAKNTLGTWWHYFLEFGYTPADARKARVKRGKKGRRRYKTRWTKHTTSILKSIIDDDGSLYLDEVQQELFELSGEWWSPSTISRKLHNELGYSLQVATIIASQKDAAEQAEFLEAVRSRLTNPNQLVFVDESQKDKNAARRRRSWSKRGLTPFRTVYFEGSHGFRYTLIAACDVNGFIYEACEPIYQSGSNDTDPTHGTVDQARFKLWVIEKLIPTLGKYHLGQPRSIMVMDNASIHRDIRDLIEAPEVGAKLIYLSAYSPELNPIELMFGLYKVSLRRSPQNEPHYRAHSTALLCITPDIACTLFKHSKVPLCEHYPSQVELKRQDDKNKVIATIVEMSTSLVLPIVMMDRDDE